MTTDNEKAMSEAAERAAEKEWNDYQEHLRIGGNKLHVRSFVKLGAEAGWRACLEGPVVRLLREALDNLLQISGATRNIDFARTEAAAALAALAAATSEREGS